jgi:hypothetical protein
LCSFLHSAVIPSLLGPNIFLRTLFTNTLILRPCYVGPPSPRHCAPSGCTWRRRPPGMQSDLLVWGWAGF